MCRSLCVGFRPLLLAPSTTAGSQISKRKRTNVRADARIPIDRAHSFADIWVMHAAEHMIHMNLQLCNTCCLDQRSPLRSPPHAANTSEARIIAPRTDHFEPSAGSASTNQPTLSHQTPDSIRWADESAADTAFFASSGYRPLADTMRLHRRLCHLLVHELWSSAMSCRCARQTRCHLLPG